MIISKLLQYQIMEIKVSVGESNIISPIDTSFHPEAHLAKCEHSCSNVSGEPEGDCSREFIRVYEGLLY